MDTNPPSTPAARTKRVLIVDDQQPVRELFAEVLATAGWSADLAAGADEALVLVSVNTYDLLITDWAMPGLNGAELHQTLSQHFGFGRRVSPLLPQRLPPVLVITGYYDLPEVQQLIFGERVVGILRKPVSCKKLIEVAEDLYAWDAVRKDRRRQALSRISGRLVKAAP